MAKWCYLLLVAFISALESCLSPSAMDENQTFRRKVQEIIGKLESDTTSVWIYKDIFNEPSHIGVTHARVQKSLSNVGDERRLTRLLVSALRGCKVSLPVIGGSISRGATFAEDGQGNRIFFRAVESWWNIIFSAITGSTLTSQSISLGGVGTDYYSYCLSSHLHEDHSPKLILWELSANDRGRYNDKPYPSAQPLEQLTRNVLQRFSKPVLIFLNFFRAHDYLAGRCLNYEDEGEQTVAKHYQITSISWRNFVCENIEKDVPLFGIHEIFGSDNLHPSILGHAQMAFLLIHYLKTTFLRVLKNIALSSESLNVMEQRIDQLGNEELSPILYHETSVNKPMCYTYFMYNEEEPNNTLPIQIVRRDDFHFHVFKKFKIRTDKLAGMQTIMTEQLLQVSFSLPHTFAKLVLVAHSATGNAQVWIDRDTPVIIETDDYHMGTRIELVTTNVPAGNHLLNVLSLKHGFAFCGLAVI